MLFAITDDRTVWVLHDEAHARREFEAIDVQNGDVTFYDAEGSRLRAHFPVPRKLLGVAIEGPSDYRLTPEESAPSGSDDLLSKLEKASAIEPNPTFESIEELRAFLLANRTRPQSRA